MSEPPTNPICRLCGHEIKGKIYSSAPFEDPARKYDAGCFALKFPMAIQLDDLHKRVEALEAAISHIKLDA